MPHNGRVLNRLGSALQCFEGRDRINAGASRDRDCTASTLDVTMIIRLAADDAGSSTQPCDPC